MSDTNTATTVNATDAHTNDKARMQQEYEELYDETYDMLLKAEDKGEDANNDHDYQVKTARMMELERLLGIENDPGEVDD